MLRLRNIYNLVNHLPGALALLAAASLAGCGQLHYALQAGAGEYELLAVSRPIDSIVARGDTPERLRRLLVTVGEVKAWGESQGLTPTRSFQNYSALDRPVAVWVVSACPELSLQPKLFSFPIAGDVPYLGWFNLRAAKDAAKSLREEGLDVDLRGASAFSTLGWFHDPLLSSMIGRGDEALGGLVTTVLHESVHATLYIPGETPFNEGLAEMAADVLSTNYLAAHASPREIAAWSDTKAAWTAEEAELRGAGDRLLALYASTLTDEQKRAEKKRELDSLQSKLRLGRPPNNALLAEHRAYSSGRDGFTHLYAACGEKWPCFFGALRTLSRASFERPNQLELDPLLDALAARVRANQ